MFFWHLYIYKNILIIIIESVVFNLIEGLFLFGVYS